jgi:RNA polymerase sigma-70 factor (ECF subfamily)
MTEDEIIESVLAGNRNDFIYLVEKYQSMVFRTCMGFVHNKDDADDLTQEVFINAYQWLKDFKGSSAFSTWLYRIAINRSLNHARSNSRQSIFQRFEKLFGAGKGAESNIALPDGENPEQILIHEEHRQIIQRALDSLPENQRTALVLSKYEDLPQKEIAQIMNTTEGAVEALIQRGKANLRDKLFYFSRHGTLSPLHKVFHPQNPPKGGF